MHAVLMACKCYRGAKLLLTLADSSRDAHTVSVTAKRPRLLAWLVSYRPLAHLLSK